MKAVLLLAHGTPESLDQMPAYLTRVRGGRPPSPELIAEMRGNYGAIGGRSPLTDLTRAQAAALAEELGGTPPVFFAMRNWRPFIADVIREGSAQGVDEWLALPLVAQCTPLTLGKYEEAVTQALPAGVRASFLRACNEHSLLIEAFTERALAALAQGPRDAIVFTAHSLPVRAIQEGDPYAEQVAALARAVGARLPVSAQHVAYQSAGRTADAWLGPSLDERLAELAAQGVRRVLVVPIGFVCDHTEILFDIDIQAQQRARALGLDLLRSESLNTSPTFIRAMAAIVREHA
jgi:protoporphyrin/coproporphyrin ferrochelatase